jgi:hypothetical protein
MPAQACGELLNRLALRHDETDLNRTRRPGPRILFLPRVQSDEQRGSGQVAHGSCLPSTRALARRLGISRNTALAAYDELASKGFTRSRRGAGVFAHAPAVVAGFDMGAVMRAAQFPARSLEVLDLDGNPVRICY